MLPGVPGWCGVEVRDATTDPDAAVCIPKPLPLEVPGKATKRRPVMMPAMTTILTMLRINTVRLAERFLPASLSAGKFLAIPEWAENASSLSTGGSVTGSGCEAGKGC